jgi:hypothetical protein
VPVAALAEAIINVNSAISLASFGYLARRQNQGTARVSQGRRKKKSSAGLV